MNNRKNNYYLGVQEYQDKSIKGIQVYFASEKENCGIILYDRKSGIELARHAFWASEKVGNVFCSVIPNVNVDKISYLFYEEDNLVVDKNAIGFVGTDVFGVLKDAKSYKAIVYKDNTYDWEDDKLPMLAYEDCIGYCMHIRGFTMHKSSKVKAKGTFRGVIEKIPYLKELGITTLELQPAYEFNENPDTGLSVERSYAQEEKRVNYWGYQEGYYYSPKRAYAYGKDALKEFKDMVKALHKNNMELIMQFYFPDTVSRLEIGRILRFWRMEYHVDGFHLKGLHLPIKALAEDVFLKGTKLWYYDFPLDELYSGCVKPSFKNLAVYNDAYTYNLRRLLTGEGGMLYEGMRYMSFSSPKCGVVNYLTNYDGFTMADLVSYNQKHNEVNGELNRDGTDYNCSWNCGKEGITRSKKVNDLRKKQVRNGFALLLLSQGMPLFFMGDEFGNSQKGNNNPYCQDNEITWLDWSNLEKNKALLDYVKMLIAFRREKKLFGYLNEKNIPKSSECSYPQVSYHGSEAWKPDWSKKHIGFMLCGNYAKVSNGSNVYVAINMDDMEQIVALPKLPKGVKWIVAFVTAEEYGDKRQEQLSGKESVLGINIAPRSIAVLYSER